MFDAGSDGLVQVANGITRGNANGRKLAKLNAQLTGEVSAVNGYASQALVGAAWSVGATPSQFKFDCDNPEWEAAGGSIVDVMWAVIWDAVSGLLLCRAQIDDLPISVPSGSRIVLTMNAMGVLTLKQV